MTLAIINMSTPLPNHPGNNGIAPNSTIVSNWVNVSSMYQLTAIISQVNSPGTIYIDQSNDQITYTSVSSAYTELEQLTTSASSQYARIRVVTGSGYTNSGYAYLSGTTAISGAIIDNGGQVFNVLAYGAKGDGVTDDTAAINGLLSGVTGGIIYAPPGTYIISAKLLLPSNIVLLGAGSGTIFRLASNTSLGTGSPAGSNYIIGNSDYTNGNQNIAVMDLIIDGNKINQSGTQSDNWVFGLAFSNSSNCQAINVTVHDCSASGILIEYSSGTILINRCQSFSNGDYGANPNYGKDVEISDSTFYGNVGPGIYTEYLDNFILKNNLLYGNQSTGVQVARGCHYGIVEGNLSYNNLASGIVVSGGNDNTNNPSGSGVNSKLLVHQNQSFNNYYTGIEVDSTTYSVFSNNVLVNNSIGSNGESGIIIQTDVNSTIPSTNNLFFSNTIHQDSIYSLQVSSISGATPSIGSSYSNNSSSWEIIASGNLSTGSGTVWVKLILGTNSPLPGTMTYLTGGGSNFDFTGDSGPFTINGGIKDGSSSQVNNKYVFNSVDGVVVNPVDIISQNCFVANNSGYNPTGPQTAPTMPASGTALTNPFPFDCTVYIAGGTVTAIEVDGATTGLTSGSFFITAGSSITLTYSVAPTTFEWIGN